MIRHISPKGFTLVELMVVIVIVGTLATLSIVHFKAAQESALDKEVRANLKLIAAAEKLYKLETGGYLPAGNETVINEKLRLILPVNATYKNWNYTVSTNVGNTTFLANGTRSKGTSRTYTMNETEEEPHL